MNRPTSRKPRPPLDGESLEQLALFYVGRYATTRAKLRNYLKRKIRERGWSDDTEPPVVALAEKLGELGYIDDQGFASSRAASLSRRGYGPRRVEQALHIAGIEEDDRGEAFEIMREEAWNAANVFAKKRRFGPYAEAEIDPDKKRKLLAAMMRAGHDFETAKKFVDAHPGEFPEKLL